MRSFLSSQYKTKKFKKLKDEWYKKLEKDGFVDAEDGDLLKEWQSAYFQIRHEPEIFSIQQSYYYEASHFLNIFAFPSELEKKIWALHVEGKSYREIALMLKADQTTHSSYCSSIVCDLFCPVAAMDEQKLFEYLNKDKVSAIINRIKEAMKQHLKKIPE